MCSSVVVGLGRRSGHRTGAGYQGWTSIVALVVCGRVRCAASPSKASASRCVVHKLQGPSKTCRARGEGRMVCLGTVGHPVALIGPLDYSHDHHGD